MTAADIIAERKKPFKPMAGLDGIYADLKHYPDRVDYYVQCPVCRQVHGTYRTMKEAHSKKTCERCSLDQVKKIKKQVQQVIWEPQKKVKPLAAITQEAESDSPPLPEPELPATPVPEVPEDDDPFDGQDPWDTVDRLLFPNWVATAMWRLAEHLGCDFDDIEIQDRGGDYSEYNPESTTYFTVDVPGETWMVFKDDSAAHDAAVERVAEDVRNEPGNFSTSFLAGYIDKDELARAIGDPYEDYGDDERSLDYEEQLEKMVEVDKIYSDDPLFFKVNGDPRVKNKARVAQLDAMVEEWIEETKPEFNPWDWLEEMHGKEGAAKAALELVSVDEDRVANDVVGNDGWSNTLATHDGHTEEIGPELFVICRTH
jgi:hypothetical protein